MTLPEAPAALTRRTLADAHGPFIANELRGLPLGLDDPAELRLLQLDCGTGEVLKPFAAQMTTGAGEMWGVDRDSAAIEWAAAALPPLRFARVDVGARLPFDDGFFDVVVALQTFTGDADWASWLLEIARVLRPGGQLVAGVYGAAHAVHLQGLAWREDEVGREIRQDLRGSSTEALVSSWWLKARWGRVFDVGSREQPFKLAEDLALSTLDTVVATRRDGPLPSTRDLEADASGDDREPAARARQAIIDSDLLATLRGEVGDLDREYGRLHEMWQDADARATQLGSELDAERVRAAQLAARVAELEQIDEQAAGRNGDTSVYVRAAELEQKVHRLEVDLATVRHALNVITGSRSWKLTGPLRAAMERRK